MGKIHFIERGTHPENLVNVDKAEHIWDTGIWYVAGETAERLLGGTVFLHEAQDSPSFFGGQILSYRMMECGPDKGKIIFRFKASMDAKGVRSAGGWGMEKKIDFD